MLLSVIGGNKDVPNLMFFTSTNYLKKIDEAIKRRFDGQFQVGRLVPKARAQILLKKLPELQKDQQAFNLLIKITSNFTGAALKNLPSTLQVSLAKKK
jgi:SpoVK/Ycf46/Vps4 family AAA+-type ATPase